VGETESLALQTRDGGPAARFFRDRQQMGDEPVSQTMRAARIAGVFYLLNIVTIFLSILVRGTSAQPLLQVISTACSVVVAALLYEVLKAVNESLSLTGAFFRLLACAVAVIGYVYKPATQMVIVFFGFHFIVIGYLIFRSPFLWRWVGVLTMISGAGALIFAMPGAMTLFRYFIPLGLATELSITVCLFKARGNSAASRSLPSPQTA
jgi:hypothetical protein